MGYHYSVAPSLQKESSGSIVSDGTEQTLLTIIELKKITGSVDLTQMLLGDTVMIRQYLRVVSGGSWKKYAEETYTGVQPLPLIYITPKETDFGIRITLQQTAGVIHTYEYNFIGEK